MCVNSIPSWTKVGVETVGTWIIIFMVKAREGTSTIGEKTIDWSENDTLNVPHWTWASHQAMSDDADLFIATDREVQERLNVAREETA
ncbi:MAG: hypothetical protein VYB45_01605 [Pseudomonadota bacterium]|jgi:gentisate 1,2-dioxygenase|nr:hypothetical protein [Rhodospirillaceae bacterium]MEE2720477.1 hypothetical protein [Pseudomonadota bacterium]|tara:strand:- start:393 stop:656 length:264 start_codon:yes stop_codon:yes gene_type:complete